MNVLNVFTIAGIEIPGWTLETAIFWLLFVLVVITVLMIVVFAVLLRRVGRDKTVVVNAQSETKEAEPEPAETVDYEITVSCPEELKSLQVALYNGNTQVGSAANVAEGKATVKAPAGDYIVKVYGLPDDDYEVEAEVLSATKLAANVTIKYCEDYEAYVEEELDAEEAEEELAEVEEETVNYEIYVVAPEELKSLQVALFNGNTQIGAAANVVDGKAIIAAPAGEYYVKVFCLPDDDYIASVELLSATNLEATVTITYCEDYEPYEEAEEEEEPEEIVVEVLPELVEYNVTVESPENLPAIQIALYNGNTQIGSAVNVENGAATIKAEAGEYTVKVFGLNDEKYEVSTELLSSTKLSATVTITEVVPEEPEVEEVVPTVSEVVELEPEEPELINYNIVVHAPEGLPALQVALYNGDERIGMAVNVESGAATISAPAGDYVIRLFGLPEGYEASAGSVSESRHIGTITVSAIAQEVVEETAATEATKIIVQEEGYEGGILRYDRSFTARLIQSDNEVKNWYTDIKNELLSYKKVHDRMSWKRESYNYGRLPFARLAYRGETLCLYLPLNPADFAESKYKVEDVSEHASYSDTPCMYRIKNNKRARYALELIEMAAEKLEAPRITRESQDYYVPYEGLVELIKKGLVKRNIKDKSAEIFFEERRDENK